MDTIDEFIDRAKVAIENDEFNHGTATLKIDMITSKGVIIPTGTNAIITAFLPDMNIYGVLFDELGHWVTFEDVETFKHFFDYELKAVKDENIL